MKHYDSVIVPETTRLKLQKITCDMCGDEIKKGRFSEEEVTIQHKTGKSYPEGGSGEITGIDMCPECFVNKLTSWLESQGCSLHTTPWEW